MQSFVSDEAYLEWLKSASEDCLPRDSVELLYSVCSRLLAGEDVGARLLVVDVPGGLRVVVPASQLPEAWANMLHVYCLGDYRGVEGFVPGEGWVVVDVGAYLGFYTLWAASLVGSRGLVLAVEPNPYAREVLYTNIALNHGKGLPKVVIDPRAACSGEGVAEFYVAAYWANSSIVEGYAKEMGDITDKIYVKCSKLDMILEEHGIRDVDLVKLDVEGYELEALRGAEETLRRAKRVVVEVHPPWASVESVASFLERKGFRTEARRLEGVEHQVIVYAWRD